MWSGGMTFIHLVLRIWLTSRPQARHDPTTFRRRSWIWHDRPSVPIHSVIRQRWLGISSCHGASTADAARPGRRCHAVGVFVGESVCSSVSSERQDLASHCVTRSVLNERRRRSSAQTDICQSSPPVCRPLRHLYDLPAFHPVNQGLHQLAWKCPCHSQRRTRRPLRDSTSPPGTPVLAPRPRLSVATLLLRLVPVAAALSRAFRPRARILAKASTAQQQRPGPPPAPTRVAPHGVSVLALRRFAKRTT